MTHLLRALFSNSHKGILYTVGDSIPNIIKLLIDISLFDNKNKLRIFNFYLQFEIISSQSVKS